MIDAHHHLWVYSAHDYGWITDELGALRRNFLVDDLRPLMREAGVTGLVSVQAQQTIDETRWLLAQGDACEQILGVVGWVPLVDAHVEREIERLASNPKLKGVRHVLQDEPDDEYMLREDFNAGVSRLREYGLTYDVLIYERHLPHALAFVDRHPRQVFVLDHVAKPRIRDSVLSPWSERIRELARREHVYCKVSGMVTEASWRSWAELDLRPYFDVVLEAFGPRRLMFGSDWPVLTLAAGYEQWASTVRRWIASLSPDERAWIEWRTASEAYRLPWSGTAS
jgi:L-fuconolactonase